MPFIIFNKKVYAEDIVRVGLILSIFILCLPILWPSRLLWTIVLTFSYETFWISGSFAGVIILVSTARLTRTYGRDRDGWLNCREFFVDTFNGLCLSLIGMILMSFIGMTAFVLIGQFLMFGYWLFETHWLLLPIFIYVLYKMFQ